ncbi:MAG TPA: hypothetical protein VIK78_18775 [Ruminiclostridium sp.]
MKVEGEQYLGKLLLSVVIAEGIGALSGFLEQSTQKSNEESADFR